MRRLPRYLPIFTVLIALGACSKAGPQGGGMGGFSVPVEVASVRARTMSDDFRALGSVESEDNIRVAAEVAGRIQSIPFAEGRSVHQGELLAQLDDREFKAQWERAEAQRQLAATNFERSRKLAEQQAISTRELDDARANQAVAEANASLAKVQFEKTRIRAPFEGVTGHRLQSVGGWIQAGDPITDLTRLSTLRVSFAAPERMLGEIHVGRTVAIHTPAFPGQSFSGVVTVVDPTIDPATRTLRVVARVPNRGGLLRPGMSADVAVTLAQRAGALAIPDESVFAESGAHYVFVVKPDSSVTRVEVQLGARDSSQVEIKSGLTAGQVVVRAGHQKLFEGAHVIPVSDQAAPPGGAPASKPAAAASQPASTPKSAAAPSDTSRHTKKSRSISGAK